MKKYIFFFLLLCGIAGLTACSNANANSETEFWVRGNCEMCKSTIETALKEVPGVASAAYDLENHTARIGFDSSQTNRAALLSAVAGAGYDTKEVPAKEEAYAALPNCCKKTEDR